MAETSNVMAAMPQQFTDLFEQLKNKFTSEAPQMTYQPQSESSLKAKLTAALRPAYDQQIAARQQQTQAARAQVDADAAARGVGSSTWLTDAKSRLKNAEASDVTSLNSGFLSNLANQLISRLSSQESNRLSTEQYNANQKQTAYDKALQLALQKYGEWGVTQNATGGGGGGGTRTPEEKDNGRTVNPDDWTMEDYLKYLSTLTTPKNPFPDATPIDAYTEYTDNQDKDHQRQLQNGTTKPPQTTQVTVGTSGNRSSKFWDTFLKTIRNNPLA